MQGYLLKRKVEYKLRSYAILNNHDWHFRGINANGDNGYVVLDTRFLPSEVKIIKFC